MPDLWIVETNGERDVLVTTAAPDGITPGCAMHLPMGGAGRAPANLAIREYRTSRTLA